MRWDEQANGGVGTRPAHTEASGPDDRMLYPFRPILAGSVCVAGVATPGLVAALRATARSVATDGGSLDGTRHDTVVLVDPQGPAPGARIGPDADGLGRRLERAARLLRPGGHLVVVVENALSLRRLAVRREPGAALDPFGVADPPPADGFVRPTRQRLRNRLSDLGLSEQDWWFPFPDHRLTLSLVAERGLATGGAFDPGLLAAASAPFDPECPRENRGALQDAWTGAARAGLLGDFAPAFAVAASAAAAAADPRLALHFGHRRRPAFDKVVSFARAGGAIRVTRAPLHPGLARAAGGVTNLFPDEAFVPGAPWQAALRTLLAREGWQVAEIVAWAAVWRDAVRVLHAGGADLAPDTMLPGGAVDAIPRNLMHRDGIPVFIDAEWEIETLSVGHLLVRGLVDAFTEVEACEAPAGPAPTLLHLVGAVAEGLGLALDAAALDDVLARESRFQTIVSGIETRRDRAWLAATRLATRPAPRAPLAARDAAIARLRDEIAALRTEGDRRTAAHTAALDEAGRRTDRVIRYAAELDRERGRLVRDLADARIAGQAQVPPQRTSGARLRRRSAFLDALRAMRARGFGRTAPPRDGAQR